MIVSPSRNGRMTCSKRSSSFSLSLKALKPKVCLSLSYAGSIICPSQSVLSASMNPPIGTNGYTASRYAQYSRLSASINTRSKGPSNFSISNIQSPIRNSIRSPSGERAKLRLIVSSNSSLCSIVTNLPPSAKPSARHNAL